jgi:hypothetical protein
MVAPIVYSHTIVSNDDGDVRLRQISNSRQAYRNTLMATHSYESIQQRRLMTNVAMLMDCFLAYSGYSNVLLIAGKNPVRDELNQLPLYHNFAQSEYNLDVLKTQEDKRWDKIKDVSFVTGSSTPRLDVKDFDMDTDKKYDAIILAGIDMWRNPKHEDGRIYVPDLRHAFRKYITSDSDIIDFNRHTHNRLELRRIKGERKDATDRFSSLEMILNPYADGVYLDGEHEYYFNRLRNTVEIF